MVKINPLVKIVHSGLQSKNSNLPIVQFTPIDLFWVEDSFRIGCKSDDVDMILSAGTHLRAGGL